MATVTQDDIVVTSTWANAVATQPALANTPCIVQNVGQDLVYLVAGGASAPAASKTGLALAPLDSFELTATSIWLKAKSTPGSAPTGLVSVVLV